MRYLVFLCIQTLYLNFCVAQDSLTIYTFKDETTKVLFKEIIDSERKYSYYTDTLVFSIKAITTIQENGDSITDQIMIYPNIHHTYCLYNSPFGFFYRKHLFIANSFPFLVALFEKSNQKIKYSCVSLKEEMIETIENNVDCYEPLPTTTWYYSLIDGHLKFIEKSDASKKYKLE